MHFSNNIFLKVVPEKYSNDIYDIVNLFYNGAISRSGDAGEASRSRAVGEASRSRAGYTDGITAVLACGAWDVAYSFRRADGGAGYRSARAAAGGREAPAYAAKMALYYILKARAFAERADAAYDLPWGALVGIRPVKMYRGLLDGGYSENGAAAEMARRYDVPATASLLCARIVKNQKSIIEKYDGAADYSLYVGIPFCRTKCAYCSFPSDAHSKAGEYAREYVGALTRELKSIACAMRGAGRRLRAVYIGGGTPTALPAPELERLLREIAETFGGGRPDELTVEAGRADTMDREKLSIINAYREFARRTRICVNPQTMNDATLKLIGRGHSSDDAVRAFWLAREIGFDEINMDVIAGLPGEGLKEFGSTLDFVAKLGPESFTAHTLCIKRSSRFNEFAGAYAYPDARTAGAMLDMAHERALSWGMAPYYLYRQKNTIGNLANVGYSLIGRECEYNVHEMADVSDVLAAGAGAVSKFIDAATGRIERVFNVKNLLEYINRVDEMILKKERRMGRAKGKAIDGAGAEGR